MAIIQALAFMIGMGTGNFIARMIGAGNRKLAEELASIAFFTGFGVGLVIAVIGNANIGQLVRMLGSTETIAPSCGGVCFLYFCGCAIYDMFLYYE